MEIKIGVKKTKKTQILHNSIIYLHPRERLKTFTIIKIGLHRRVFIITMDTTKLHKYLYTLNISYRTSRENP